MTSLTERNGVVVSNCLKCGKPGGPNPYTRENTHRDDWRFTEFQYHCQACRAFWNDGDIGAMIGSGPGVAFLLRTGLMEAQR